MSNLSRCPEMPCPLRQLPQDRPARMMTHGSAVLQSSRRTSRQPDRVCAGSTQAMAAGLPASPGGSLASRWGRGSCAWPAVSPVWCCQPHVPARSSWTASYPTRRAHGAEGAPGQDSSKTTGPTAIRAAQAAAPGSRAHLQAGHSPDAAAAGRDRGQAVGVGARKGDRLLRDLGAQGEGARQLLALHAVQPHLRARTRCSGGRPPALGLAGVQTRPADMPALPCDTLPVLQQADGLAGWPPDMRQLFQRAWVLCGSRTCPSASRVSRCWLAVQAKAARRPPSQTKAPRGLPAHENTRTTGWVAPPVTRTIWRSSLTTATGPASLAPASLRRTQLVWLQEHWSAQCTCSKAHTAARKQLSLAHAAASAHRLVDRSCSPQAIWYSSCLVK